MTLTRMAPTRDICGEAATWDGDNATLWWTDINRFLLHALRDGRVESWSFAEPVVALSLTDGPHLLVALGSRVILWSPERGEETELARLPGWPEVRLNDGRTDPRGDFWVGSMANNVGPEGEPLEPRDGEGKLFRLENGALAEKAAPVGIANTLCWSPDRARFYFADTLRNEIRVYDYDAATGAIATPRPFFAGFERGLPDGSAMDAEGCLWNARYGGGCVVRVLPDGAVDRVVEVPAQNVTTCCFGGPDLATLFVTTASTGESETNRQAGDLFAIAPGVSGLPENRTRI